MAVKAGTTPSAMVGWQIVGKRHGLYGLAGLWVHGQRAAGNTGLGDGCSSDIGVGWRMARFGLLRWRMSGSGGAVL
ncbi:hypothetical protein M0R45_001659 [Rubus argutus]|uniref:Uncharacterized protein n=1 Tax=Rubus argutus TaxID=59490 RepID=A0AAW1VMB7_RUBAR